MEKGQAAPGSRRALQLGGRRRRTRAAGARLSGTPSALCSLQASLADRLVFAKIRDGLGGGSGILVSGSAPLAASIAEFFHGIGLPIIEGYGLTETAPILTVNPPDAPRVGTVGRALPASSCGSPRTARSWRAARTS